MGITRGKAFPSKYFSKEDVLDGPIQAVIRDVRIETVSGDKGDEDKPVLYFDAPWKPMFLNQTNWITLEEELGHDSDDWIDKAIEIYHDPGIMVGKERKGGQRVRVPGSRRAKVAAPSTTPVGGALSWADALAMATAVGMTKDQLISGLKVKGMVGWNANTARTVVEAVVAEHALTQSAGELDNGPAEEPAPF